MQDSIPRWNALRVECMVHRQRILQSPTEAWQAMAARDSPTANHMDHVHVTHRA